MASTHCNNSLDGWTKNTINLRYTEKHIPTISAFQPIAQTILPIIVRYHWSEDQRYKFFNLGDGINNMKLQHIVFWEGSQKALSHAAAGLWGLGNDKVWWKIISNIWKYDTGACSPRFIMCDRWFGSNWACPQGVTTFVTPWGRV